ncbi:MAG: hypothetical protein JXB45_06760 [Candidatus Krumholzibacteriota bacterium]|nr:hypothetical protein [Candidatus Krumholzibacteriota bacterium]
MDLFRRRGKSSPARAPVIIFGVIWGLIFFSLALPVWKKAVDNQDRIERASQRFSSWSEMSAAGVWLEALIEQSDSTLQAEYNRLFPFRKDREKLFLELARMAESNGIDPFTLREVDIVDAEGGIDPTEDEPPPEKPRNDIDRLAQYFATDLSTLPRAGLRTFRCEVKFDADYCRMVRFLTGLKSVSRAITLHALKVERSSSGISVAMEFDYYAQNID